jgi:hypothetical protein
MRSVVLEILQKPLRAQATAPSRPSGAAKEKEAKEKRAAGR